MLSVYRDMLYFIGNALNFNQVTPVVNEIDWSEVYELGKQQQVLTMLYAGIRATNTAVPQEDLKELKSAFCTSVMIEMTQQTELDRIMKEFEKNGIDYLPLKGMTIKKLYPDVSFRPMADADILIREYQYSKIQKILTQLGFIPVKESDHEYVWNREGVLLLELHKRLISTRNTDFYDYFGDGWKHARRCEEAKYRFQWRAEDEFIFLFAHFAKHYRASGIGIRHMVDIAVYLREHSDMDMEYVVHELEQIGLKTFFGNVVETLQVWFQHKEETDVSENITAWLFENGVFENLENERIHSVLREGLNGSYRIMKVSYMLKRAFPTYKVMQDQYPFLTKHPLLLPVAWVFRICRILCSKDTKVEVRAFNRLSAVRMGSYEQRLAEVGLKVK